jgi:hypothetical protein
MGARCVITTRLLIAVGAYALNILMNLISPFLDALHYDALPLHVVTLHTLALNYLSLHALPLHTLLSLLL